MFVGHYGVSFAVKGLNPRVPLWVLFVAVQLLDVIWAPLVLAGIEKVRLVPGITASNPFDLHYMPYSHSLVAAALWSVLALLGYWRWTRTRAGVPAAALVALAVLSHWLLDFVVHRPDLPLYDDAAKVGLGLWNRPALAFALESILLFGGMLYFLRGHPAGQARLAGFGLMMLAVQAGVFFGPTLPSARVAAATALASYVAFAGVAGWWERRYASAAQSRSSRPA